MAKQLTLTARIIRYMLAMGYVEVEHTTRKYRVFKPIGIALKDNPERRYFVGTHGAVRSSAQGRIMASVDVASVIMKHVEKYEQENGL